MRDPISPPPPSAAASRDVAIATERPTLFLIHFLGGSARTWDSIVPLLSSRFRCVAIDLPGFGDAAATPGYGIAEMADVVARVVRYKKLYRWWLVGHSMGAKVAMALARRTENGEADLGGLSRLVLLAGSPPSPEPMAEQRRQTMMGWFRGSPEKSREEAAGYIDQNRGGRLPTGTRDKLVADVLRARREAWLAWLDGGSREDWTDRVGILKTPALIVAGESDNDLGPAAQVGLMAHHLASMRMVVLGGAGHLLPLERAEDIARLIVEHAEDPGQDDAKVAEPVRDYAALIASDRVSARTRAVLRERGLSEFEQELPTLLTDGLLATLRALVDRVLPQPSGSTIDLAARIDADLARGRGDGWRFAILPPDAGAYRAGLRTFDAAAFAVHGAPFAALDAEDRDRLLERAAAGDLTVEADGASGPILSAAQMRLWFEDVRADAVRAYVAHPATLARLGYSGVANGGDGPRKQGFVLLGAGERERWEPIAKTGLGP